MVTILNGYDLKQAFDCDFINAVDVLWQFAPRKETLKHNFPEKNGQDVDFVNTHFDARAFTFHVIVSGGTMPELKRNYFAFWTLLKQGEEYILYNDHADLEVTIYYENQSALSSPRKNSKGGFSIEFDLNFSESDPDVNLPNIYLVDDAGRFLVP